MTSNKVNHVSIANGQSCLTKANSLMHLSPWLENTLVQNFKSLKTACLDTPSEACKEAGCLNQLPAIEYKEGGAI